MPTIDWDTVVTAGATAAFVTLAVEYFVKPSLEARKEQILEGFRTRRELLTVITRLSVAAAKYKQRMPDDTPRDLQKSWDAERGRHYDMMLGYAQQLSDDLDRFARVNRPALMQLIMTYVYCVHGVALSGRSRHRKAELIAQLGIPMELVVQPSLRRPVAWGKARDELLRLVAQTEEPTPPVLQESAAPADGPTGS
jgi:hypothetical protein